MLAAMAHRFADAQPLEPRQHFVAKERKLIEIIDEGDADAGETDLAERGERFGDVVGIADQRLAAIADSIGSALTLELFGADRLRRDVFQRQQPVDRREVGVIEHGIAIIVLGFLAATPTSDRSDGIDVDLAAILCGEILGLLDIARRLFVRHARGLNEKGIGVAHCEGAADGRCARIHQQRPNAADRFRLGADAFELDVFAVDVEVLFR
jgi:hypothetical protein